MITEINSIDELEKPKIAKVTYPGHEIYQCRIPNYEVIELSNQKQDIDRLSNNIFPAVLTNLQNLED